MNILLKIAAFLCWIAPAFALAFAAKGLLHYVQLSSYQVGGYVRAVKRLPIKSFWPGLALGVFSVLALFFASLALKGNPLVAFFVCLVLVLSILLAGYLLGMLAYPEKKVKVKLVLTHRAKRLWLALLILSLFLCWLLWRIGVPFGFHGLLPMLLPILMFLAMYIIWPVEKIVQRYYMADAGNILSAYRNAGLEVIGVTGSYGKTTVKNILYAMLSQKVPTLATPASFNTPLGLSRCIREEMGPEHRYFIAEMGARHPQDIRVLCRLVTPKMGILTAIGPQHLETMGSLARVKATKYDLIKALPKDGFAVFNDDGKHVSECYQKTDINKALVGSVGSAVWAEDMAHTQDGSSFTLCLANGQRLMVTTALSGEHNIRNILMAAAMALQCGVSIGQIATALQEVRPIASRLQMSIHPKGYKVINNGFNSNPDSSRKALEVLGRQTGRLIVVTPGFIELGRQEKASNRRLGNDIAAVAQIAILIGEKHTRPILEGLKESGMAAENILVFSSLADANRFIQDTYGPGDVLLYENDLPDHYA